MGSAYGSWVRPQTERVAAYEIFRGLQPFPTLNRLPFPDGLGPLCDSRPVVASPVGEPVSMRAGWTSICTSSAGGMRRATCPAWSATTSRQTSGATCPPCRSPWPRTRERCTTARYTSQASPACWRAAHPEALSRLVCLCSIRRGCAQWRVRPVALLL